MLKRLIIVLLLFCSISFLLKGQSDKNKEALVIGVESDIDVFTPWDSTNTVRNKILWNIFEPLVILKEKSTEIQPHLAESWKVNNNNTIWEITLREGIKFHDGSLLTADDVIASASLFQGFQGTIEKIDSRTIRFILPEPNSGFLSSLAQVKFAIAPAHTVQEYKSLHKTGRLQNFSAIGSGPFKFSRWQKGNQITLDSFENYWNGAPSIKNIIYKVIPDNKERINELENGTIDLIDVLFPADLSRIKKNAHLRIASIYGMNICYIAINTTHKPLDNAKVRRALNLGVDKLRLTRMFYFGGYGVPTNRVLSPAFWGFNAMPAPGNFQPALAKQILSEEGISEGLNLKFVCIPMARPYLPNHTGVAEEIKNQLANIGVNTQVSAPANWTEFQSILSKGDFDLALTGWISEMGDPDYLLTALLSGESLKEEVMKNYSRWNNQLFDEKLKTARKLPLSDVRGRIKLYNEAQKIFQEETPWIPLFHTKIFVIHNRRVKGVILYPSSMLSFYKVQFTD
jgi:ABC-type transport system substrate-binding protein